MKRRVWLAAVLTAAWMGTTACDGDGEVDAGPGEDAGAAFDAGPPVDPTTAEFEEVEMRGDGPWGRWGYMVAAIAPDEAVIVGGTDAGEGNTVFEDAWRVRVLDGALEATSIATSGPGPRYCGCMAYDAGRDRLIVYGGRTIETPALPPGTWELDLASGTWTEVATANQLTGTLGCAMAHHTATGNTYMFGGAELGAAVDQTWRYDPTAGTWIEIDASGPVARYDGAFFETHDGEALYLFGGSYGAMGSAFYADLWRFDPMSETWTEIALPAGPEGRRTPWVVRDPARHGIYVGFGYDGQMRPMGDFHYADLDALTWTEIEVPFDTGPVGRGFAFALPGGDGSLGVLLGGYGISRPVNSAYRLVR